MDLERALAIIDEAADAASNLDTLNEAQLEALQFVWDSCSNRQVRDAVEGFVHCFSWRDNAIGRFHSANANRNRIRRLICRPVLRP